MRINYFQIYLLVFLISLLPKILIIIYFPSIIEGNDQEIYLRVAKNILSGCGIAGGPDNESCNPTSMGPKVPGYPIMLAFVMLLSNSSYFFLKIFNALTISFSIIYFLRTLKILTKSKFLFFAIGTILSLSPITLPWSRFILTEPISISITLIIFADLFQLIYCKKFNIIRISFFLIIATFVRVDLIFLVIPIMVAIIMSYRFSESLKKLVIIFLILAIPWTLWFARNYYHGLQVFPQHLGHEILSIDDVNYNDNSPSGYVKWLNSWTFNYYQVAATYHPMSSQKYRDIFVDFENMKLDEDIINESKELLNKLINYSNQPFPKAIDDEFRRLAQKSISRDKFNYYLILPFKRIIYQWGSMTDSNGWPIELKITHEERIRLFNANFKVKTGWILDNLATALLKVIPNFWRLTILVIFLISLIIGFKDKRLKNLILVVLSYFLVKNIFAGYANFIEVRYLVNLIPLLEIICCLSIISIFERKKIEG